MHGTANSQSQQLNRTVDIARCKKIVKYSAILFVHEIISGLIWGCDVIENYDVGNKTLSGRCDHLMCLELMQTNNSPPQFDKRSIRLIITSPTQLFAPYIIMPLVNFLKISKHSLSIIYCSAVSMFLHVTCGLVMLATASPRLAIQVCRPFGMPPQQCHGSQGLC